MEIRREHRKAVRDGLKSIIAEWKLKIDQIVSDLICERIEKCDKDILSIKKAINVLTNEKENYENKTVTINQNISNVEKKINQINDSIEDELQLFGDPYREIRKEELDKRINGLMERINLTNSGAEICQLMAFIYQIKNISKSMDL